MLRMRVALMMFYQMYITNRLLIKKKKTLKIGGIIEGKSAITY